MQKIFPQWKIVKNLGGVMPWPYPADGALRFYRDLAIPQMERGKAWRPKILQEEAGVPVDQGGTSSIESLHLA